MKKYLIIFFAGVILTLLLWLGVTLGGQKNKDINLNRSAVILQIRELSRLETASFTIEKVIEAGTNYEKLKDFLFGDHVLLIAHGEVIAGFDMSQISEKNIKGKGTEISITLPSPRIISTRLDNDQTKVFDRKQGLLTKGEINLEAEARRQAEMSITEAACQGKILEVANTQGKKQLEILLKAAGFTEVTIFTSSPGICP